MIQIDKDSNFDINLTNSNSSALNLSAISGVNEFTSGRIGKA